MLCPQRELRSAVGKMSGWLVMGLLPGKRQWKMLVCSQRCCGYLLSGNTMGVSLGYTSQPGSHVVKLLRKL